MRRAVQLRGDLREGATSVVRDMASACCNSAPARGEIALTPRDLALQRKITLQSSGSRIPCLFAMRYPRVRAEL